MTLPFLILSVLHSSKTTHASMPLSPLAILLSSGDNSPECLVLTVMLSGFSLAYLCPLGCSLAEGN